MSNSARIWIGYALIAATLPVVVGVAYLGMLLEATGASALGLAALVAWFALLLLYFLSARCWKCKEPLHHVAANLYAPIVLRRDCLSCGVKHSTHPVA